MAQLTKDELLNKVREHGGETPDDFTISLLEDISDSFVTDATDKVEKTAYDELNNKYAELRKSYADRFTVSAKDKETQDSKEVQSTEPDKEPEIKLFE